jgi:hypothetical protein
MAETCQFLPESRISLASDTIMVVGNLYAADRYGRVHKGGSNPYANALACWRPHWMARLPDDVQ